MKKNSLVGKLFVVPLKNGGYSVGLVARQEKNILLGYFFDTYFLEQPSKIESFVVDKNNVCLICLFGILGLKNNEWTVIGDLSNWDKNEWSVPIFKQKDLLLDIYYAITYDDDLNEVSRVKISKENAKTLFKSGIHGSGVVESILSDKLKSKQK
jgi:hypothetical protein